MTRCIRWSFILALVLLPATVAAQTGTVRGRVTEVGSGTPLTDVQVRVEGTTLGGLTRENGEYTIVNVPAGARTISARRLGFAASEAQVTVPAGGEVVQDFSLRAAAITLDEILVSGVATPATRREVPNTVETVSGEAVAGAPAITSIDQALQGRITGAVISENSGQPGGGISIRLRGTNSILGGAEPLYVIDGVIIDNSSAPLVGLGANATYSGAGLSNRLADLDPSDVERIEVLKGAAAAALYGSRANNGVIQIFTRRGQAGTPRITFQSEISTGETPEKYELMMDPRASLGDIAIRGAIGFPALAEGDSIPRYDIQDEIFRRSTSHTQRLSASGGSAATTYFLSGSWQQEEGILRSTEYERKSFRANLTQQIRDNFEVGIRGNFVQSNSEYIPEGEQTQGVLTSVVFTPTSFNPAFDETAGRYPYNPLLGPNPYVVLEDFEAPEAVTRFVGGFDANWRPMDNVTVRYVAGLDDYRREARYFMPARSTSASFTGSIQNPVLFSRLFNQDLAATHIWAPETGTLALTSGAGFRYTQDKTETVRAAASNLPYGQILVGGATQNASQGLTEVRTVGWYFEERVSIADRLHITGGLNWDASSAFGTDSRLQMFPRLGASYIADEEPGFASMFGEVISSLRLRAAYGETGGQPPGAYTRFENYVNTSFAGRPGLVASVTTGNPDLKPERQREIEAGFDLGVLNQRAELEFTWYDKETRDLVLSVPLPPSSGSANQFQNIGTVSNKGIELALNTLNVNNPNFTWRTRLTYAKNTNNVEKLGTPRDTLITGYLNAVVEGHPIGVFYGNVYVRNADGTVYHADTTLNAGLPTERTYFNMPRRARDTLLVEGTERVVFANRIIGDPNPDFVMSLLNTFDLPYGIQATVLLDGRFGNDVANFTRRITQFFGSDKSVELEVSGDTVAGAFTRNPIGRINIYEEYIEDGSFVKLREISLGMRLSDDLAARLRAQGITLRLAGRNLYTWTDYSGLDPEVNLFSANTVARGVDFATTPIPRQFTFSVTLNY